MAGDDKLQLDPNPTAKAEAQDFQNPDDKRRVQDHAHELALLQGQQGPIGRLIGCSDSSLTIAFVLLFLGFILIIGAGIGMAFEKDVFSSIEEKLITFELTVAGFVFGKNKPTKE